MILLATWAALVLSQGDAVPTPKGILVDRIIAVVDGEVLTETELLAEVRIALVLRRGSEAATRDLDDKVVHAFREYVVNQMVVAAHVRRLGTVEVSNDRLEQLFREFHARFPSVHAFRAFLRRFDVSETKLSNLFRRDLRNQVFIDQRLRSRQLTNARGGSSNKQWSAEDVNQLLSEMRETVRIRLLGPNDQLELQ